MVQSRYKEAEPLFQRALTILEKVQDDHLLEAITLLEDYAALLSATKREAGAAKLLQRAGEIRVKYRVPSKGTGLCLASASTQEPAGPALASLTDTLGTLTCVPVLSYRGGLAACEKGA